MIQDKTLSAVSGCSLIKDGEATALRLWLPASLYLLRPCSRARAPDLGAVGHTVLNHLLSSLWASREGVVQRCRLRAPTFGAPLVKDAPLPTRRALRPSPSRLAEPVNILLKEYKLLP